MIGVPAEEDLIAYVDERLDPARAAAVSAWLAERPDEEKRIAEWRRQAALLRAALDPVTTEPVPAALKATLHRQKRSWWPMALAAGLAALLALPVGAAIGWGFSRIPEESPLVRLAEIGITNHRLYAVEVRHPVEVTAAEQQHLTSWLSKRTDVTVKTPDLSTQGLKLLGGRLISGDNEPAAQIMYEGTSGERYTLLLEKTATKRTTAFRSTTEGNTGAVYWLDGNCAYVLSGPAGPADKKRLWDLARAVYDQFDE